MKTTIYRADDFYNNMGDLKGFFLKKEDAEAELEYTDSVNMADGNFSEITEFQTDAKDFDISNNEEMLSEEIWGDSDIIASYYYK